MKSSRKGLLSLLMIFLFIGIIVPMFLNINIEGMEPGNYPISVSKPILYDTYKVKENPGLSTRTVRENNNLDYPIFPAGSCGPNNIRYWRRPNNGKCAPSNICGGIYESTEQKIPEQPEGPTFEQHPRVNYYVANNINQ